MWFRSFLTWIEFSVVVSIDKTVGKVDNSITPLSIAVFKLSFKHWMTLFVLEELSVLSRFFPSTWNVHGVVLMETFESFISESELTVVVVKCLTETNIGLSVTPSALSVLEFSMESASFHSVVSWWTLPWSTWEILFV